MHPSVSLPALALAAAFVVAGAGMAGASDAEPPQRIVSLNGCTDQLAMLVAGEGQLHSVSYMAIDPGTSVLQDEARRYVINHGLAEEVFLMQPDLVVTGTFSSRTTINLLRRLGFRVEEFALESSFDDVRDNIERMGELFGRLERAAQMVAGLDAGLRRLEVDAPERKTVALYDANSYTFGAETLFNAVIGAAGLTNLGETMGFSGAARLPLELLILASPDLVATTDDRYEAPSLAEHGFSHPAFRALAGQTDHVSLPSRYTACGTPFTLVAARMLQEAAR